MGAESGGVVTATEREELYVSAFRHGAEAALAYIEQNYPGLDLGSDDDDSPPIAKATMEHIEGVAALIANPLTPRAT